MAVDAVAAAGTEHVAVELRRVVRGTVETGGRRRAEYSTDASNYRVVPEVVVCPRDRDDVLAVAEVARRLAVPLTARGAGTSIAGNAIGPGIVMDLSRHFNRILELDPGTGLARVEPGVILGSLQRAAAPHGLRFGPDPSTWARCTLGGMIGNNACGSHSLSFGRTADNVVSLEALSGQGCEFTAGRGWEVVPGLAEFTQTHLGTLRTELGRFGRQVSGYSLEHLLPENGRNLAAALVGSEGTCVTVLEATVRLVPVPVAPLLVVLGYPDMASAADAVPVVLGHEPGAVEGLDARLVDAVRRQRPESLGVDLPAGNGWLLVELSGEQVAESVDLAGRLIADAGAVGSRIVTDPLETRAIWRIREDGVGLAGRTPSGAQTWPGFEDAAVPPERLGGFLRELDGLLAEHGLEGMPYGHFGDGCLHLRLDIPLDRDPGALRRFMPVAAQLVARHGGSLSGEHGDGRARSELLPLMYSPEAIAAFAGFKRLFDPADLLNPGVLVAPAPLDADLRRPQAHPIPITRGFAFGEDDGDLTQAVHRCVGIGKCRADNADTGGFMCPSYLATRDEKDSTRGRSRVLQELAIGMLVPDWSSAEVAESLELCLSCKACATDCPAGVDMARLKSEVLFRKYDGRGRPISHYVLGQLPRWARLASPFARLINRLLGVRLLERLALRLGGMESRRSIPRLAPQRFRQGARMRGDAAAPAVLVWADSFTEHFSPRVGHAALDVLEAAGYRTIVPAEPACCGLTWISTGQLTAARRRLRKLVDVFHPYVVQGIPVLGLEPSCTATLRSDLVDLLPDDPRSAAVAEGVVTLAELLARGAPNTGWSPPALDGIRVVAQPHCHQHAVMGYEKDLALMTSLGAEVQAVNGCCGLAGNFGMERGHYDTSVAVAENGLLPALREGGTDAVYVADGFSCRVQGDQLAGRSGVHLAELLAERLPGRKRS